MGGLNEESKMKSVRGESDADPVEGSCGNGVDECIDFNTRNFDLDDWKLLKAEPNSPTKGLKFASVEAMASSVIVHERSLLYAMIGLSHR